MDNRPIGVFDSGVGGLTAMRELEKLMPGEKIIYLGDSANMPYGEKDRREILQLSKNNLEFLLEKDIKAVFVACGTATITALDALKELSPVPVFGVVDAAVEDAVAATKNGRIGVLATRASIRAGVFQRRLLEMDPTLMVEARACPVFATIVEQGLFDRSDPRVSAAAEEYLPPLRLAAVDTVILGCTHYPLLSQVVREYVGAQVNLISSGAAAARKLAEYLCRNNMTASSPQTGTEIYTTGDREEFSRTARLMLNRDISGILTKI